MIRLWPGIAVLVASASTGGIAVSPPPTWRLPHEDPSARIAAIVRPVIPPGDTITERAVTVPGPIPLPGVLTLPAGVTTGAAAVVIVHGSGPGDRDGTVGVNKPYRDLARGLAGRGVVVLRYDKRSRVEPAWFAGRPFTVKDEVIDDVVSALHLLRRQPEVDSTRVYIVGHSLGGYLAPRIAGADGHLAGMIVLAGAYVGSLGELLLTQMDYIATVSTPADSAVIVAQRQAYAPYVAALGRLTPADSGSTSMILGAPASYWIDLDRYDPVRAMRERPEPALLLQGERDYQVTPAMFREYLRLLGERPRTEVRTFPGLNHLFTHGEGPPRPAEYALPGRVADEVIAAIAGWISR